MDHVQKLKEVLAYHNNLYYNQDAPEISDAEYDALKKQYLSLVGKEEYDQVPGEADDIFPKYPHTYPIKSLAKVNSIEDLRKELIRLAPGVIQPKLDGLTLVIYPDGAMVTRADGTTGENIVHTARKIHNIKVYEGGPVRVEAVISKETFKKLNEERISQGLDAFKNPRNAVAGMLRNKDASKVKGVTYRAFNIVGSELRDSEQLQLLKGAGFDIVGALPFTKENIEETIQKIVNFNREGYMYEIDGLVIKSDIPNALKQFGETGHHPKSMVAYKFPSQGVWTKIIDVINQTGRTGKITPVAVIEPTELMGSTISRVTLHNYGMMDALKISKGCDVHLIKANDVIPAITQTRNYDQSKAFVRPTECPVCSSHLETVNDQQFCRNVECGSKLLFNICHIAKRDSLDIEGLSEETVKKIIEAGYVSHPFDLFDVTEQQILQLEGFAKKSATKLYGNIQKARNCGLKQFIYAAGIPNIGRSVSEDIANYFKTLQAFLDDIEHGCLQFSKIEGVGPTLVENVRSHWQLLTKLREKVTPNSVEVKKAASSGEQFTVVITGTLEHPRSYYENIVKEHGHKVSGSISAKTSYLLAGEKAGSKLEKAQKLGVKILTSEQELLDVFNSTEVEEPAIEPVEQHVDEPIETKNGESVALTLF